MVKVSHLQAFLLEKMDKGRAQEMDKCSLVYVDPSFLPFEEAELGVTRDLRVSCSCQGRAELRLLGAQRRSLHLRGRGLLAPASPGLLPERPFFPRPSQFFLLRGAGRALSNLGP